MKVTRVIVHENKARRGKPLLLCSVVLDDCLMISDIRLFSGEKGYYLCLPSKQDVFREVQDLNGAVELELPSSRCEEDGNKKYEEFYHPVDSEFYRELLGVVVGAYDLWKDTGRVSLRPKIEDNGVVNWR